MSHPWNYSEQFSFSSSGKYKGLINQGATCYLNSVLQVLFMTDDFREAVERYPGTEFIDPQLKSLFEKLRYQTTGPFDITKKLDIKRVCEQQDAAECFEKILNLTSHKSSQIFFGKQAHRTVCSACKTQTDTDGKFWHLPLTLVDSNGVYSVANGVKDYFRPSTHSGENQMYCEQCNAKRDATVDCVIKHHPQVLLLLLKRFELNYNSMTYYKINRTALIPYTLQIPKNQTYELYAVVDHAGDLDHGHYSACIKSQEEDRWLRFDDVRISEIDCQEFQSDIFKRSDTAYLLFYRKKSEDIGEVSAPGGRPFSTGNVENQCQEADVVNGVEHQDNRELDNVGKSTLPIKIHAKGRQEGGKYTESYRVEETVRRDFKAALEVNSGADKVEPKKFLKKWDLVVNTTHKDVKVDHSMQNMMKGDQVLKQGSGGRFESHERQREKNKAVQRAEEQKRRDEKYLQRGRALMTKPDGDTDTTSSDDQDGVTRPEQKVREKGDSEPDRDSASSSQTGQAEAQGEVRQTQARAESEGTVEENHSSDKSGTCIVRIYEDEKRVTPSVTVRSTEKMDIKLKTLRDILINRGGSIPFQEVQNKKINLDLRTLLAKYLPENMFEIRCQSPAPQSHITIHGGQV